MFKLTLQRNFTQFRDQKSSIDFLINKALIAGRGKWKVVSTKIDDAEFTGESRWLYTANLTFNKDGGKMTADILKREWVSIKNALVRASESKFAQYPWVITDEKVPAEVQQLIDEEPEVGDDETGDGSYIQYGDEHVRHALHENTGVTFEEVRDRSIDTIKELLASEHKLRNSEWFKDIFDREAQIRSVLSSLLSFYESNGHRRNHIVLYGLPACAKTQIVNSVVSLVGADAVVKLDGTSTTPAGIYKVYFDELEDIPTPPIAVLEEAEKTSEESLRVWLGALDDRGELRKVNARRMASRKVNLLCIATVNDKDQFDKMMGGSTERPGALSSRFVHQLYCPRPDKKVLKKILTRDVKENGGKIEWVEPALELAARINTDDPRRVLGFLDGGDRLLSGAYQKDVLKIHDLQAGRKAAGAK